MDAFWTLIGKANTALWANPMLILALGTGIILTVAMKVPQIRMIPTMVKLLFNGKASDSGLSSFQAFTLAIAGRVGTGNIAGVATAVCMGGPGAIFWMWIIAIVGSATTFVECSMSQLHKKKIDGEYKGGWVFYIGDKFKILGAIAAILFIATLAFTQTGVHSNTISSAIANGFGVPKYVGGILIAIMLSLIVFGGAKRIGKAAELIVPFMSGIYIVAALVVLAFNYNAIPGAFATIFKGAFGADQVIGAAMGSAMIWGTKRAIFSSETGMATSTPSAASAEVSHPAKQGLVQAFSIYIDTLFVCTATGLMLVVTGSYNVLDADGNMLHMGLGKAIEAGPIWVQTALDTVLPFGSEFVAFAMFFFGFTTILNQTYSSAVSVGYFFQKQGTQPKLLTYAVYGVFIIGAIYGSFIPAANAWSLGDTGLGIIVWVNYLFLLGSMGVGFKLLKDFEEQKKSGIDPVFDPDKFANEKGFKHFDLGIWREIRDKYKNGELKS